MGYEKYRKGDNAMNIDEYMECGENYYGRNFGFRTKRTSYLYDYSINYNGISWKYAKTVEDNDRIPYLQIMYVLSEIAGKFLYQTIKPYIENIKDFLDIFRKDEFGRTYTLFKDYKAYALSYKKLFKLNELRKKKEVNLWLLRL